jgi:hypothetical protein
LLREYGLPEVPSDAGTTDSLAVQDNILAQMERNDFVTGAPGATPLKAWIDGEPFVPEPAATTRAVSDAEFAVQEALAIVRDSVLLCPNCGGQWRLEFKAGALRAIPATQPSVIIRAADMLEQQAEALIDDYGEGPGSAMLIAMAKELRAVMGS